MATLSINAHFDGTQIKLDEDIQIPKGSRLLVTLLDTEVDPDREAFLKLAAQSLDSAYGENEPDYSAEDCIAE